MFFNKNKKIGKQISTAILNSFRPVFMFSEFFDLKSGVFTPPNGFWKDPYILGFSHAMTGYFIHFDFNGKSIENQKRGEIIIYTFQNLCGDEWREIVTAANDYAVQKNNSDFQRAYNDASTLVGVIYGILNPKDEDPILVEAKKLAPTLEKGMAGMSESVRPGDALVAAVSMLTIEKHVRTKYLKEKK